MHKIATISAFILTLILYSCGTGSQTEKNNEKFDGKKWKTGDFRTKGKMTDNILNDSLLIGKTKAEILEMLGDPDQYNERIFHYAVDSGVKYMNEPWIYWLSVDFDTINDTVRDVWLAD